MKTLQVDDFKVGGYMLEYDRACRIIRVYEILDIDLDTVYFRCHDDYDDSFSYDKVGLQSSFETNAYFKYSFAADEISMLAEMLRF